MLTTEFRQLFRPILCISLISILGFQSQMFAQKAFVGRLEYHLKLDNPQDKDNINVDTMIIYTNDTIVRIETRSKLGEQILIKHLKKQKSYLLLNVSGQKFAIQTNIDTTLVKNTTEQEIKYFIFGCKKIAGLKSKKAIINRNDLDSQRIVYYSKKIRPDLLDVYEGIKGLPVDYYLQHTDGIYHYTLKEQTNQPISRDLFGIPSDYVITTFDDFLKAIRQE
jgi:hypothetical protein